MLTHVAGESARDNRGLPGGVEPAALGAYADDADDADDVVRTLAELGERCSMVGLSTTPPATASTPLALFLDARLRGALNSGRDFGTIKTCQIRTILALSSVGRAGPSSP